MGEGGLVGESLHASTTNSRLREKVDDACQRAILVLVLAILVWAPLAMAATRLIDFAPVEIMTAAALGLWVVRFWTQRPFRLYWPPVCWGVYAFVAYALARAQWVVIPVVAHREMLQVIVYGVLFLVIANNLNRRDSAEVVLTTWMSLGMVLSLLAIYQFATHSPRISPYSWALKPQSYWNRGSGTFVNPDNFAGFMIMLIPLGVASVLLSRMSAAVKVLVGYATAMMIAGLCVSVSRGAMVACVVSLALMCVALLFGGGRIWPALVTFAVILIGAIVVRENFDTVARSFDRAVGSGPVDIGDRKIYWAVALKVYDENRIWGGGPAHLDERSFLYCPEGPQMRVNYAHNDYLNTLADWGVVGLAIIVAFLCALFYIAWRTWRTIWRKASDLGPRQTDKGSFVIGATFALTASIIHCFIDFDMHVPADALLAVALMALLVASARYVTERYWKNPGAVGKLILAAAAVGAAAFLALSGFKLAHQQRFVEQADAAQRIINQPLDPDTPNYDALVNSPERQAAFQARLEALKHAYEADPTDASVSFRLAESYWDLGAQADLGYKRDTLEAMKWYSRAILADPLDGFAWLGYGKCLDWLERHDEATYYFDRAGALDPSGWGVAFYRGKHCVELSQFTQARDLFFKALYRSSGSKTVLPYYQMVNRRLAEDAKK